MRRKILKTYPSWAPLAEVSEFKGEKFLQVKVSAPFEPSEHDLIITTFDNDLTVYFDWYHAHFGRWYETPEDAFEQAKIFIDEICKEDFIVGIKMVNGQWAGSYTPSTLHEIETDTVTYTRSWLGTHNRQFDQNE